jgi:hypothetical protein
MDAKFTPGPWRVGALVTNAGQRPIVTDDVGIAWVHMQKEVPKKSAWTAADIERDANAHLIAAAPELYEAAIDVAASLVAAISLLEAGGKSAAPSDKMFAQMLVDYRASLQRARATLRKARGEA